MTTLAAIKGQTMSTPAQDSFPYDVFVSYSHLDRDWVDGVLLPRLEAAGVKVHIDHRDFAAGVPFITNMENAVQCSRHVIVVLSSDWAVSEYAQFEGLLVQSNDPIGRRRKLIPLMLKDCKPSPAIAQLTFREFRNQAKWDAEWPLLFRDLDADNKRAGELSERGLRALIDLMQTPAVRGAVLATEHAFGAISGQITVLNCYKALHDAFQKLEDGYDMLTQLKKRVRTDPTGWDELDLYFSEFQDSVQDLLDRASQAPFAANEAMWMQLLEFASRELQASIDNRDVEQLTSATDRLNKILGHEPSRLNNSLVTTGQNLQLGAFVKTLATIRDSLLAVGLRSLEMQHLEEFKRGIDALDNLNLSLNSAIRIHSALQGIYDELYPVDPLLFQNLRDFENVWRFQRMMVLSLKNLGEVECVKNLSALANQVEDALAVSRNLVKVRRLFQDYRYKVGRAFHRIDKDLLIICGELQKVGTLLASLLGRMQNE